MTKISRNAPKILTKAQKKLKEQIQSDKLFEKFFNKNSHFEDSTVKVYEAAIMNYCLLQMKTPTELIDEAIEEQIGGVHPAKQKIYDRLLDFQNQMLEDELSFNYMSGRYGYVKSFYRSNRIIIEGDERIKRPKYDPEPSDDQEAGIPSLEMMQEALEYIDTKWKAIITLMSSSGMGASEIMSLTYEKWLQAISCEFLKPEEREKQGKYVNLDELTKEQKLDVLLIDQMIKEVITVVPVWKVMRKKTKFEYKTFSTPESVKNISDYLKHRNLQNNPIQNFEDPLFMSRSKKKGRKRERKSNKMSIDDFTNYFKRLRPKFQRTDGLKKHGNYYVFRSHSMRKYAGSKILEHTGLDIYKSDWLLGHKRKGQDRAYYMKNTGELRVPYMSALPKLSINWDEADISTAEEYRTLKQKYETQQESIVELVQKNTEMLKLKKQYENDSKVKNEEIMKLKAEKDEEIKELKEENKLTKELVESLFKEMKRKGIM